MPGSCHTRQRDATGQDALDGAAVEHLEDLGSHAKYFLLCGKRHCRTLFTTVLVCLDHDSLLVMWTPRNLTLNPLHYSPVGVNGGMFTHDCMAKHDSNTIIKFADDTTVVGLITDNDETARQRK